MSKLHGNTPVTPSPASVIIVAAGSSVRFGGEIPKQYTKIMGKPVLYWTIKSFLNLIPAKNIHIVIHPDHNELFKSTIGLFNDVFPEPIIGASTRQGSVHNAVKVLSDTLSTDKKILIHDAARASIHPDDILAVLHTLDSKKAATLVAPVTETLRQKSGEHCGSVVDRDQLLSLQTPQGFYLGDLVTAHQKAEAENHAYTDDTALVAAIGIETAAIYAAHPNLKITTLEDLMMTELHLSNRMPQRLIKTGMGFDVHAFGEEAPSLRIGGIDIPHTHKLLGHSDADVALHAITDAIYGVLGDGDIGSHFPPSKAEHKNQDSAEFLKAAVKQLVDCGGRINHVDTTIICEAPKVGPHRDKMRERIADILGIPLSRVAVKATTTEQLGFTGRKEGIAAQAVVTAEIPESE